MKKIVLVTAIVCLALVLGAAGFYAISRMKEPMEDHMLEEAPYPPSDLRLPLPPNPETQLLMPLSGEQKESVLAAAEANAIVSDLKRRLGCRNAFVEENGIALPRVATGWVMYRGQEWDMRVSVDLGNKDVIAINIQKHRAKSPQPKVEDIVKIAERNPLVAKKLSGKQYIVKPLPPSQEGEVVAFLDEKSRKHLFAAEINPQTGRVKIIEPQRGGAEPWQVGAILLLALLVAVLAYMYFSPRRKQNQ